VLSTVTWVGPNGGDWDTASNWNPVGVPTAGDDVEIEPTSAETITHSMNQSDSVLSLTTNSNATLNLTAGTLNIGAGSSTFSGPITVASGVSMVVAANASVQIPVDQTLTDNGTLSFASGDTLTLPTNCCGSYGQIVASGVLNATGTTFSGGGSIMVNSGGVIDPTGSAFGVTLTLPYNDLATVAANSNVSFDQIDIESGTLSSGTLALNLMGTNNANLSYDFPSGFTVGSGGELEVGSKVPVTIPVDQTLTDDGTLSFASGDAVTLATNCCGGYGQIAASGILDATDTTFSGGGAVTINSGGVIDPTGSAFGVTLTLPDNDLATVAAGSNVSFDQVDIESGTLSSGTLALNLMGTNQANLSYAFPGGFTVGSTGTLAVGPGVPVTVSIGQTLTDDGTLTFASGDTVTLAASCCGSNGQIVASGVLNATGTTFKGVGPITVNSGGVLNIGYSTDGVKQLVLDWGSNDTIEFTTFTGQIAINSGATVNIVGNNLSGVGNNGVIATGSPTATIPLEENYWATNDPTAIGKLILDHNDDATRPTVNFQPVWANAYGTIASPVTVIYSSSNQNVTLTAAVATTGGIPISGGTETFTILNSNNQPVGQTTSPANVVNGSVSATYQLPGGTAVGQYTIEAQFSGSGGFLASTDTSQLLTVTPLASQVAITSSALNQDAGSLGAVTIGLEDSSGNPGATSASNQTISLGTTSTAGAFYANQSGGTPITRVVIPAGQSSVTVYYSDTKAGTPTITASDSALSSSPNQQETVNPAAVAGLKVTTNYASPDPAGTAGTVTVAAYDQYGNLDNSGPNQFEGTVDLSSTDTRVANLPFSYTFTAGDAGSHAFSGVVLKSVGNQTFTATDTANSKITGTSAAVDVVPAPASVVVITSAPLTLAAGTRGAMTVQLEDAYGNPGATSTTAQTISLSTTSSGGAFYASSSGGSAITSVTIAAGQSSATFYYADTKAGSPTVTASDSAINSKPVQQETITVGAASQVAITSAPIGFAAGGRGGPIAVSLEDAYGNPGATSSTAQTIGLATTSSGGAFYASSSGGSPITIVTIAAGQSSATFYYGDTKAGTPTITASDSAFNSSSNQQETVTSATATQVAIVSAPPTLIAGVQGGPITVQLEDANGNPATSTAAQTIKLSTTSAAGAFYNASGSTITSVTIAAGQTSATFYYGDTKAATPTITAADSALNNSSSSQQETINPAAATHFVVTTSFGSSDVAGTPGTVTVTAKDQYGNTAGSGPDQYLGTVDLTSTDSQISGLPATYGFTYADAGSHTFTNVALDTAGNQTITATDSTTSTITGTSPVIDVTAAKATQLGIKRPPGGVISGVDFSLEVDALDPYNNTDTSFDGSVTVGLASGSGGNLSGTLTETAVAGVAQFNALVSTQSGGISLAANSGNLTTGSTGGASVTVDPAGAAYLVVTTSFANPDVAGSIGTVAVTAYDQYNNVASGGPDQYLGTVDLTSTDSQISGLPATYTFTAGDAGSHTFTDVALKTAGSQTITATDSATNTITGTSAAVNVVPAPANQAVLTSAPLTLVAGNRGPITVQLEDPYGNLGATSASAQAIGLDTTSSAAAFYASSSGGTAITSVTIAAGQSTTTFYYKDIKAGTPTVTASDSALSSVLTQQETVNPAAASQVTITNTPLSLVAGSRGQVSVRLEDTYGNPGATSTTAQTIGLATTSSAGAFYAGASGGNPMTSVAIPVGQSSATVYYGDTQAGGPTVTVSDTALSSSVNQAETVNPAAADHFAVTTSFSSSDVAGTAATVTVTAKDHYGNTAGSGPDQYLGTVDLGGTDSQASGLPSSYAFTAGDAGSHTFSDVALKTAGDQTIKATDSASSTVAGDATVDVVPAAASRMAITSPALNLIAGSRDPVTVQLEDTYGNPGAISGAAQTIDLVTTGTAGAFYATQGGSTTITSVVIPAGQSSATVYYGDTKAGTPKITATDSALSSSVNQVETVNPAAADHFVVTTTFPSSDVAGTVGTVTIAAYDHYNNLAGRGPDQYLGTVDLTSTDNQISGLPPSYTFTASDAGSHTFTNVVLKTAGNPQTITATDSLNRTVSGSSTVAVKAATATHLVVTTPPPSPLVAGHPFTMVVSAEDPFGNVVSSFSGSVTITLPGGQTVQVQAQGGVATFPGLTVGTTAQGGAIQVTGGGLPTVSTPPINVNTGNNAQPPTITGEQVVTFQKKNKKGKPVGKPVLQGFILDFSTAMNAATAGSSANYVVAAASTKRVKKKPVTTFKPVPFAASYNAASHSVTLTLVGKQTFAKGGEITVIYSPPNGVSGADNVPLSSDDATFTIARKGSGLTLG
jgi:hypothetical protein